MKTLSTTWVPRSRRKLRSSRGENWVEDSCRATTVRPRTSAITVTTVLVTVISSGAGVVGGALEGEPVQQRAGRHLDLGHAEPDDQGQQRGQAGQHPERAVRVLPGRLPAQRAARAAGGALRLGDSIAPDMVDSHASAARRAPSRAEPDGQPPPKSRAIWAWKVSTDRVPKSRIAQISMTSRTPRIRIGAGRVRRLIRISRPE